MDIDNQNQNNNLQNQQPNQGQGYPPHQQFQQVPPQIPAQPQSTDHDPGKGLGIASLIFGIIGMSLVSLPLGIVARNKSRSVGKNNIPAVIGIVLSVLNLLALVFLFVFLSSSFNTGQNSAKQSEISSTIAQSQAKLGEYYAINEQYPPNISDFKAFLSETGNTYTAEKLTTFDSVISYRALKEDRVQECVGQNLDCQEYEIKADPDYWNGDEELIKTSR